MPQVFEVLTVSTFILGFLISTFEMLTIPKEFKRREIAFFESKKIFGLVDKVTFGLALASFVFFFLHLAYEQLQIMHLFTYVFIVLYMCLFIGFFVSKPFARYLARQAIKTTEHQYFMTGIARLIIVVVMVSMPVLAVMT